MLHQGLPDFIGARPHSLMAKLLHDSPSAVTALIYLKNGYYLLFHGFAVGIDLMGPFIFPVIIATAADG
jgi:hypothetical protein